MSDQPYTPTTEQIELLVLGQLKQPAEKRGIPVDVEADRADFRRWLATIEAAAEQRGMRLAQEAVAKGPVERGRECVGDILSTAQALHMIDNAIQDRADHMEGDE